MASSGRIDMAPDERIVAACDELKSLADDLAEQLAGETISAGTPTEQLYARQAVFVVRQVHAIALLLALPYYAEQAGQLVRGLAELARVILWLDAPKDADERRERALAFWKDGIAQTRKKYEYQESIGRKMLPREWNQLDHQDKLIADQEVELGRTVGELPNARDMWESLERADLYGLFRWESDPSHGSAVTLGTVVRSSTEDHLELGAANQPKDRARRLGAALVFVQLSGETIVRHLRRDIESWEKTSAATETLMAELLGPLVASDAG